MKSNIESHKHIRMVTTASSFPVYYMYTCTRKRDSLMFMSGMKVISTHLGYALF